MYEIQEIKNGLILIEKDLLTKEREPKLKKQIEDILKQTKSLIKKTLPGNSIIGFSSYLQANTNYHLLLYLIKQDKANYEQIYIQANASDKIKVFIEHCENFTDEEYWKELADAYIQQNYKKIPYKVYYKLFSSERPQREKLMNKEEIKLFRKMPKEITIYRGGSKTELKTKMYGVSWTLDKKIAEKFADIKSIRDKKEMVVIEKTISKKDVIAYFTSRQEEEIIYLG